MNELSLFTGAGGGVLATKWLLGWQTVCYVERERFPVEVLKARITDGWLDDAPIWDDVRTFDGRRWRGLVDVITAGFPCQPFSAAGRRKADADDRNGWPDTIRIIREVRPRFAFLENVPGLLSVSDSTDGDIRYFGTILRDLAESGYDARWRVLSAAEVGAPHKRDRLWIVADATPDRFLRDRNKSPIGGALQKWHDVDTEGADVADAEGPGWRENGNGIARGQAHVVANAVNDGSHRPEGDAAEQGCDQPKDGILERDGGHVADAIGAGLEVEQRQRRNDEQEQPPIERNGNEWGWWSTEPDVGRVAHGVASRVDRLKAIGNGQVPLVAATAWRLLTDDLIGGAGQ